MDQNPYAAPGAEEEDRQGRPRSVRIAVGCLICSISLLGILIVTSRLKLMHWGPVSGATGSNLLTAALLILLTFKIHSRRNWARWVFVVGSGCGFLASLYILASTPQAFLALPPIAIGELFLQLGLQAAAIISLITREATRWFKGANVPIQNAPAISAG